MLREAGDRQQQCVGCNSTAIVQTATVQLSVDEHGLMLSETASCIHWSPKPNLNWVLSYSLHESANRIE